MRLFCVHRGPLMYTKVFLRLEPLGLEFVAASALALGHEVMILDLQVETHRDYFRACERWRPDVIAFSCNYLASIPEIIDLSKATKHRWVRVSIVVGGHSASFVAKQPSGDSVYSASNSAPRIACPISVGRDPIRAAPLARRLRAGPTRRTLSGRPRPTRSLRQAGLERESRRRGSRTARPGMDCPSPAIPASPRFPSRA